MLLSETVDMKDWEATGWEIRPYHFVVMEAPPPADYTALQTPKLDELNPIGGFSFEAEQGVRKAEGITGDMSCIFALPDARYTLLQPIPVRLEQQSEEGEWTALFEEANISMSGDDPDEAKELLAEDIVSAFALFLTEEKRLSPRLAQDLAVLRRYMKEG